MNKIKLLLLTILLGCLSLGISIRGPYINSANIAGNLPNAVVLDNEENTFTATQNLRQVTIADNYALAANTDDGTDAGSMIVSGGGGLGGITRGGTTFLFGNDHASPTNKGGIQLKAGAGGMSSNTGRIYLQNGSGASVLTIGDGTSTTNKTAVFGGSITIADGYALASNTDDGTDASAVTLTGGGGTGGLTRGGTTFLFGNEHASPTYKGGIQLRAGAGGMSSNTGRIYFQNGSAANILTLGDGTSTTNATATFTGSIVGTLGTAAQTNITSVGTLTGLTLSGALTGATTITATDTISSSKLGASFATSLTNTASYTSVRMDGNGGQTNDFFQTGPAYGGPYFTAGTVGQVWGLGGSFGLGDFVIGMGGAERLKLTNAGNLSLGGSVEIGKNLKISTVTKTSGYTAATEQVILCDATTAAFTITLPAVASSTGIIYTIKKIDASTTHDITIDGASSELIDGATTQALNTQWDVINIVTDGSAWYTY